MNTEVLAETSITSLQALVASLQAQLRDIAAGTNHRPLPAAASLTVPPAAFESTNAFTEAVQAPIVAGMDEVEKIARNNHAAAVTANAACEGKGNVDPDGKGKSKGVHSGKGTQGHY